MVGPQGQLLRGFARRSDALLIADERGRVVPVTDMGDATLHLVEAGHLATLRSTESQRWAYADQRDLYDERGDLPAVLETLAEELVAALRNQDGSSVTRVSSAASTKAAKPSSSAAFGEWSQT